VVSPNVTHILGYPLEEVVDVPGFWLEHVHPEDLGQSRAKAGVQTEGTKREPPCRFLHEDGADRWLHPTVRFEYDESGSVRLLSRTGRPYPVDRRELT
jgi:PAS domain-containing protein